MNNDEKLYSLMEKMSQKIDAVQGDLGSLKKQVTGIDSRIDSLEKQVTGIDTRLRSVEVTVENNIADTLKLILENQAMLIETCAKKEDVDALREDLGLQKFRIDVITDRLKQG